MGIHEPATLLQSNTCEIPKSEKRRQISEIDRSRWFAVSDVRLRIRPEMDGASASALLANETNTTRMRIGYALLEVISSNQPAM